MLIILKFIFSNQLDINFGVTNTNSMITICLRENLPLNDELSFKNNNKMISKLLIVLPGTPR